MRGLRLIAVIFGGEIVLALVAALLFFATDGMLFEEGSGLEYYALAAMLIFVIGVTFVMPIWAVFHYRRSGQADRSSSGAPPRPSGSR